MTADIAQEMTINHVLKLYPHVMGVFNTFGIDSCCGGARSLGTAAGEDGADIDELLKTLQRTAEAQA
jgi:regulator of cell morphogenesis and NO signaling